MKAHTLQIQELGFHSLLYAYSNRIPSNKSIYSNRVRGPSGSSSRLPAMFIRVAYKLSVEASYMPILFY